MGRIVSFVALAGLATLTVASAVLAGRRPEESLANGAGSVLVLQTAVALALVAAGVLAWAYRAAPVAGALLVAAGAALDAQALPLPDAGGAVLFTIALVLGAAAPSLAGAAALELAGRVRGTERGVALAAVVSSAFWVGALPAALFDPPATGCFRCPTNLLLVHSDSTLREHVLHSGLRVGAITSILLAVLLVARVAGRRAGHWSVALAHLGVAIALTASAVALWHEATSRGVVDSTVRLAWLVQCVGLGLVAAGPLAEIARARVQSARIVDAVLRTVPTADELRSALAASAGDRSLMLVFPRDGGDPVDGDGAPAGAPTNGTITTDVLRSGDVVAQLRHGELSRQATRRLEEAVRAAGLALEHTSSRARLRAGLADLTASRARIVEVADAERRRLERDLHDGAQQRLIALSVALAGDRNRPAVNEARCEVLAALDELRTLAHGIHPASLSEGGIVPSLRELADASTVPLRLDVRPVDRLPAELESAAYHVVSDCLAAAERYGNGRAVTAAVAMTELGLTIGLRLPGVGAAAVRRELLHAEDRVAAVGGELSVTDDREGVQVDVRLRCAS